MKTSEERLRELREALLWGDPLDERARLELLGVLEFAMQRRPTPRGRPPDQALRSRAAIVGVLHERHGVALKAALFAAAPNAGEKERGNIERTYRALRAANETVKVAERLVRDALALLGHAPGRRK